MNNTYITSIYNLYSINYDYCDVEIILFFNIFVIYMFRIIILELYIGVLFIFDIYSI